MLCDQALLLGRLDLVRAVEHLLDRAELFDQLGGGLVPDAGDAGDVVRRVALKGLEVRHLVREDEIALLDILGCFVDDGVALVGAVHPEVHALPD